MATLSQPRQRHPVGPALAQVLAQFDSLRQFTVPRSYPLTATFLILVSMCLSLAYILFLCPLDLAADEAHYWEWSLNLDGCYYSKGPLVAWLIRASCECFGRLSLAWTGSLEAAVRLPAVACHGAILAGSYVLSAGVLRSPRLGLAVVIVEATTPIVRVGAVLMTIDPPLLACWCWALICVYKATDDETEKRNGTVWWLGAGLFTALGTLAKFTMALFPLAVVAFLAVHRRDAIRKAGLQILLAGSLLGWAPIIEWNLRHDWASFRHVSGQVGADQLAGLKLHWLGPAAFLGAQAGMLFGGWLPAFLASGWRFRPSQCGSRGMLLVWWCSVPVWLLFFLASIVKSGQPNWPAPAYLGGVVLAIAWVFEQLAGGRRRAVLIALCSTLAAGLVATLQVHFPGLIRPALARLVSPPTPTRPLPIRDLDITARLSGWRRLAAEVDVVRANVLAETGEAPVLAGTHWTIPGHLRFYCAGRPDAYSVGLPNRTDRHSQYDFWRPNPVADAQAFRGRTFVVVGELGAEVRAAFDRVEPAIRITHDCDGIPVAAWSLWICHGYRGFERIPGLDAGY